MAFPDTMQAMMPFLVGAEAAAAVGAQLQLDMSGESAPPEVAAALQRVVDIASVGDLNELAPPEKMQLLMQIQTTLHHALELFQSPARATAWEYTEPAILEGWGRGSMIVPVLLGAHPELASVTRMLDVGTGVGLLAVSAANVWPDASIVGIDIWEPSLERARANVKSAGLDDRIALRSQNMLELDDEEEFDCVWVPTFFMSRETVAQAIPVLMRATRPGGWIVLGRMAPPPMPLAEATFELRMIRGGGENLSNEAAAQLLEDAGCTGIRAVPRQGPAPLEFAIGQKPA